MHYAAYIGDKLTIQKILDYHYVQSLTKKIIEKGNRYEIKSSKTKLEQKSQQILKQNENINKISYPTPKFNEQQLKELELDNSFDKEFIGSITADNIEKLYVNFADHEGYTPLHLAASINSLSSVKVLISNGASPFLRNKFSQVFFYNL